MKLKNSTYDILKYIALIAIPALVALVLTVGKIWGLPYYDNIGATISAIGVFLGSLLQISNYNHNLPYQIDMDGYIDDEEVEAKEVE